MEEDVPDDLVVPLSELDAAGASQHTDARGWGVLAANGVPTGHVHDVLIDTRTAAPHGFVVELSGSSDLGSSSYRVLVPAAQARVDAARRELHLDSFAWTEVALLPRYGESAQPSDDDDATVLAAPPTVIPPAVSDEVRMTLYGERLDIATRTVDAGEVIVGKRVDVEAVRHVIPAMREDVVIERRPLPPGVGFEPRIEGDVTYIPLVEEELVVQKRLVAREELVVRKRQVTDQRVVEETVRKEVPDIRRADGAPYAASPVDHEVPTGEAI